MSTKLIKVFELETNDCKRLEACVKSVLKPVRFNNNLEIFKIDLKVIKKTIIIACDKLIKYIDNVINKPQELKRVDENE